MICKISRIRLESALVRPESVKFEPILDRVTQYASFQRKTGLTRLSQASLHRVGLFLKMCADSLKYYFSP